jgi:hypothetical protein
MRASFKFLLSLSLLLMAIPVHPGNLTIFQTNGQTTGTVSFNAYSGIIPTGAGMLHGAGGPWDLVSNSTAYTPFGIGSKTYHGGDLPFSTESQAAVPIQSSMTISGLWVSDNGAGCSGTVRLRINGLNGNETVNFTAAAQEVQDTVHFDVLPAGSLVDFQVTTGAGCADQLEWFGWTARSAANNTEIFQGSSHGTASLSTNGFATYYLPVAEMSLGDQTEATEMYQMKTAGTHSNFALYVATNTRNQGSSYVSIRKNGVGQATMTITQGQLGLIQDTSDSFTNVVGDTITWAVKMDQGNGSGTLGITFIKEEYTTTDKTAEWPVTTGGHSFNPGDNNYIELIGAGGYDSGEINDYRLLVQQPGTVSNCNLLIGTNTLNQAVTFTLRKNQADTSVVITVPAGQSGYFSSANSVSVVSTDYMDYHETVPAGTGSAVWQNNGCKFTHL